jgi:Tfp pilus assembly protein PilP
MASHFDRNEIEGDDTNPAPSPLARFELDELKLVGVVVGIPTPLALVEDPTGHGHTVRVGMGYGHFGQVKAITAKGVIIEEERRLKDLQVIRRQITLPISPTETPG